MTVPRNQNKHDVSPPEREHPRASTSDRARESFAPWFQSRAGCAVACLQADVAEETGDGGLFDQAPVPKNVPVARDEADDEFGGQNGNGWSSARCLEPTVR